METRHLISHKQFALMKPGVIIVTPRVSGAR